MSRFCVLVYPISLDNIKFKVSDIIIILKLEIKLYLSFEANDTLIRYTAVFTNFLSLYNLYQTIL